MPHVNEWVEQYGIHPHWRWCCWNESNACEFILSNENRTRKWKYAVYAYNKRTFFDLWTVNNGCLNVTVHFFTFVFLFSSVSSSRFFDSLVMSVVLQCKRCPMCWMKRTKNKTTSAANWTILHFINISKKEITWQIRKFRTIGEKNDDKTIFSVFSLLFYLGCVFFATD